MQLHFERDLYQRKLIKEHTRISQTVGLAAIFSSLVYMAIAYFLIHPAEPLVEDPAVLDNIWMIVNVIVVLIMVAILALRRTVYYANRTVSRGDTLKDVLIKWQKIDLILIAAAEIIPVTGLVLRIMGLSFEKCFHFFLGSAILFLLLTPFGIKVRSKLQILQRSHPEIDL